MGRTGWSGYLLKCDNSRPSKDGEGNPQSPWVKYAITNTADSSSVYSYNVEDYKQEITDAYGPKVYEQAVKSGVKLKYEDGSKREVPGSSIIVAPLPCKTGDDGFYYNNQDFRTQTQRTITRV